MNCLPRTFKHSKADFVAKLQIALKEYYGTEYWLELFVKSGLIEREVTKDFISKFEIALKEASETGYWLELLYRTKYIDEQTFKALSSKCASLRVMLIASSKTAKRNVL